MAGNYRFNNYENFDKNKKIVIAFLVDRPIGKNVYDATSKYVMNTIHLLAEQFNIIIISKNQSTTYSKHMIEYDKRFANYAYLGFDKEEKYRDHVAREENLKPGGNIMDIQRMHKLY